MFEVEKYFADHALVVAPAFVSSLVGMMLTKVGVVIDLGTAGKFDETIVEAASLPFYDQNLSKYVMLYTGYNASSIAAIGFVTADDVEGPWTRANAGNPILSGSGNAEDADAVNVTGPQIIYKSGVYYMFYIGFSTSGYEQGTVSMCLSTATDLLGPWTRLGAIIVPEGSGWRAGKIWHPNVLPEKIGGKYYMFFNASGADNAERPGYATADTLAGPWTVDDANCPIFSWRTRNADPCVYNVGGRWYCAYYYLANSKAYDGLAATTESQFPLGWVQCSGEPILAPSEAYDAKYAHKPLIYIENGVHYHFYTAVDVNDRRTVALAKAV